MAYAVICKNDLNEMSIVDYGGYLGTSSGKINDKDTVAYECSGCGWRKGFYKYDLAEVEQLSLGCQVPTNPSRVLQKLLKDEEKIPWVKHFDYFDLYTDEKSKIAIIIR